MTFVYSCVCLGVFLATVDIAGLQASLLTYGPLGVITVWLMLREEKRDKTIRDLSHRINGLSKALLVDILARPIDSTTRQLAKEMLEKVEAKEPT